jgi:serine/threonine protein kinase
VDLAAVAWGGFRAQDVRLGRHVALKFLPDRYLQDPTAVERFVREARAASALNHPNIVTIYDIGETDTGRFIAMELIEGRTLRAIAVQEEMAIKKLSEIGGQVAKALAVAHASGIVHRDIKPENIMVRDDGYVKVLDFGLALVAAPSDPENETRTSADTNPGMLLGTFRYMSPEQTRAEKATAASDIFSLGIVLYELATGRHPFPSDSQIGTLHAIASQAVVPASRVRAGIPESFEQLILRMLEKDAASAHRRRRLPRLFPRWCKMPDPVNRRPPRLWFSAAWWAVKSNSWKCTPRLTPPPEDAV